MDLPLMNYLTYNPLEYDVLPDLMLDLFIGESKCSIILSS